MLTSLIMPMAILLQTFAWQTVRVPKAHLEIDFPQEVQAETRKIETDIGVVDYHTFECTLQLENEASPLIFIASFYQLEDPEHDEDETSWLDDFFQATIDASVEVLGGRLVVVDDIRYQFKVPGKYYRIHFNGDRSVMRTRIYVSDTHFYSLQVATDEHTSLHPTVNQFFESFTLTD